MSALHIYWDTKRRRFWLPKPAGFPSVDSKLQSAVDTSSRLSRSFPPDQVPLRYFERFFSWYLKEKVVVALKVFNEHKTRQ